MSPRAFQTIIVASMGFKDRLELESKVLAAALKQSHARGDTSGVSLAHRQIFMLLRAQQAESGDAALLAARSTNSNLPAQAAKAESGAGPAERERPDHDEPDDLDESEQEAVEEQEVPDEPEAETAAEQPQESELAEGPLAEPEPSEELEPSQEIQQLEEPALEEAEQQDQPEQKPEAAPELAEAEQAQNLDAEEAAEGEDVKSKKRKRVMPNIVWTEEEEAPGETGEETASPETKAASDLALMEAQSAAAEMADKGEELIPEASTSGQITQFDLAVLQTSAYDDDELLEKPNFDAYGILNVDQIASFEEIHRAFLFLARRTLLSLKKAKRKQRRPLLDDLQNLWIAHDILSDPVTRTDFDFRILGLRGAPDVMIHTAPEDKEESSITTRTPLRIGELMQCASLLEQTELEIAADMHKAMPEMLFGAFLVKQGFISEEDLTQVLVGQRLLKNGSMTVGHYQLCMKRWREDQTPLEITAVAEGLVSQAEMERISMSGLQDTSGAQPRINAEEAAKRTFSAGHAVPLWKDQLDWSEPDVVAREEENVDDYERRPIESSLDIEGITDSAPKDGTKKSLRRLMEGIQSQDQSEDTPRGLKKVLTGTSEVPVMPPPDSMDPEERARLKSGQSETLPLPAKPPIVRAKGPVPAMFLNWAPTNHSLVSSPVVSPPAPASATPPPAPAPVPVPTSAPDAVVPSAPAATKEPPVEMAKVSDVPVKDVKTTAEELVVKPVAEKPVRADQSSGADFGEVNYDEEDESVSEMDYLDYADVASEIERIAHEGEQSRTDEELDFSAEGTEDSGEDKSELLKVLDEAFDGILVREPKEKTSADDDSRPPDGYETGETATYDGLDSEGSLGLEDAGSDEVIGDEESEPEADAGEADDYYAEESEESQQSQEDGGDFYDDEDDVASEDAYDVDPEYTMELSSAKIQAELSKPEPEPVTRQESRYDVRVQEIQAMSEEEATIELEAALAAMQVDNLSSHEKSSSASAEREDDDDEQSSTDTATDISSLKGTISMDMPAINMTEGGQSPGADAEDAEPTGDVGGLTSSDQEIAESEPRKLGGIEDTTDEIESIKPSELTQPSGQSTPEPEDSYQHQRLKSGEWQIVYKLEGQIADMFLADESDVETTQQMRPRLTEINTIIPSAVRQAAGETTKSGGEQADNEYDDEDEQDDYEMYDDDTSGGITKSGDQPVIKPVSNNVYPNSDSDKNKDKH